MARPDLNRNSAGSDLIRSDWHNSQLLGLDSIHFYCIVLYSPSVHSYAGLNCMSECVFIQAKSMKKSILHVNMKAKASIQISSLGTWSAEVPTSLSPRQ